MSRDPHHSPVHGGLAEPVDRLVPSDRVERDGWAQGPAIEVGDTDRTSLYRIADGTLSPLDGPLGESDLRSVLERGAIERGERLWAWTIPILLPVADAEASRLSEGATAALTSRGRVFGRIHVRSIFRVAPEEIVRSVYGTERTDHPGARLWTGETRTRFVGGEIELVPFADERPFATRVMSPRQTRALLAEREYEQSVSFQTRNPLHRAHEYALIWGAESLLRASGRRTGVFLNPLVGELKGDDVPADVRMRTYEALVEGRFLGQGDMDAELWSRHGQGLNDQLHLVGLDIRMFYGGPKEAVMHAIYRQNLGFTHFIVGRKHADAPFDDKTPIWGDFDAQAIFSSLGGELSIRTVEVGFAAYFRELGRVGLVDENPGKTVVNISGTEMRAILCRGELPDERVMRPSTAKVLAAHYAAARPA